MLGIAAILLLAISRSRAKGELPTVKTVPNPPATSLSVQFLWRLALSSTIFTGTLLPLVALQSIQYKRIIQSHQKTCHYSSTLSKIKGD
jgi:hypothetical protein